MRGGCISIGAFLGALSCIVVSAPTASAATESVLYNFPNKSFPYGRLEIDSRGALYGTSYGRGSGAIYRLKQEHGAWANKILFDFGGGGQGANPFAGLTQDNSTGIFYGTTVHGGAANVGVLYALAPAGRSWTETVLHEFAGGSDGSEPYAELLRDKTTGNLYGTSRFSGDGGCGTAFQLVESNGSWTFNTVYEFQGGADACNPFAQLRPGPKAGTLVGAALGGNGSLFQLTQSNGAWTERVIYSFTGGGDGNTPYDLDASSGGTIYGVTSLGGQYDKGVVFQLTPNKKSWIYSVIYNFRGGSDGAQGVGINFDASTGRLYGTTFAGGAGDRGTVFQLTNTGGSWTEAILHSFAGGTDGASPESRPIVDRTTGALYGTTVRGGSFNGGTVYMVQP